MADGDPIRIGRANTASNPGNETSLIRNAGTARTLFVAQNLNEGDAIRGTSASGIGVEGISTSGTGVGVSGFGSGVGVDGTSTSGTSDTGVGVRGFSSGFGVQGTTFSGTGVAGGSTIGQGVWGITSGDSSSGVAGVNSSAQGVGVDGASFGSFGTGVRGIGGGTGVDGVSSSVGVRGFSSSEVGVRGMGGGVGVDGVSSSGDGIRGTSTTGVGVSGSSFGIGVSGIGVSGIGSGIGVFGRSTELGGHAGSFLGPVEISGDLTVINGNKPFKIDHPLDPQNKYLLHNAVESSERKNVYDGVAQLDEDGEAWVDLPEWFEALNGDFRYQLTAVGGSTPGLHVAEEISENRFKIAGGREGIKVCWQVTGSRKDPWAAANPFEVEQEKPEEHQGRYLEPGLYDAPEEQRVVIGPIPETLREELRRRMEGEQRPPQPSGSDFARLEEGRLRQMMRQQTPPGLPRFPPPLPSMMPPSFDFARLEEEHRRHLDHLRRLVEEQRQEMEEQLRRRMERQEEEPPESV